MNKVQVIHGDCLDVMRGMEADSIDAVVTDPPYHLTSGNLCVDWGAFPEAGGNRVRKGLTKISGRNHRSGFMGKKWDGGDIAFCVETWQEVLRVLKPGAFLLAFSSCRTYHRMAVAVEDAGFVLHPMKAWIFGSGFPKATNFAKQFDQNLLGFSDADDDVDWRMSRSHFGTYWNGHRGGLQAEKPALEPILFAQKPLSESTIAGNVLRWGVGGINIDGTRVPTTSDDNGRWGNGTRPSGFANIGADKGSSEPNGHRHDLGRWPPNVCLSYPEDSYILRNDIPIEQRKELYKWLCENA